MLWVPPGFAHGFLAMSEHAEFLYKTTDYWYAGARAHAAVERPRARIAWPVPRNADSCREGCSGDAARCRGHLSVATHTTDAAADDPADRRTGPDRLRARPAARSCGDVIATDRAALDLADPDAIVAAMRGARPSLVINAGAYTAVDRAEKEAALARAVNGRAPGILAEEAKRLGAVLIHYSTDYVFDGTATAPYPEDALPAPQNVYGATKLDGERAIAATGARALVFRTSWVYGTRGRNFLLTIRRLAAERDELTVTADQIGAPNGAASSRRRRCAFWSPASRGGRARGTLTCRRRHSSWYDFARAIVGDAPRPRVVPIRDGELSTPARQLPTAFWRPPGSRRRFASHCPAGARAPWPIALPAWKPRPGIEPALQNKSGDDGFRGFHATTVIGSSSNPKAAARRLRAAMLRWRCCCRRAAGLGRRRPLRRSRAGTRPGARFVRRPPCWRAACPCAHTAGVERAERRVAVRQGHGRQFGAARPGWPDAWCPPTAPLPPLILVPGTAPATSRSASDAGKAAKSGPISASRSCCWPATSSAAAASWFSTSPRGASTWGRRPRSTA